jgi:hypothetical protein
MPGWCEKWQLVNECGKKLHCYCLKRVYQLLCFVRFALLYFRKTVVAQSE